MAGSMREVRPGVWQIRVSTGKNPETEKYEYSSRTVEAKGRREAGRLRDAFALDMAASISSGRPDAGVEGHTMDEAVERWFADGVRGANKKGKPWSPVTADGYRGSIKRTVSPKLGHRLVTDLKWQEIDKVYADLQADGAGPNTIKQINAVIQGSLEWAVKHEWRIDNPAKRVDRVAVPKSAASSPSPAEVRAVIEAAEADGEKEFAILLLLTALTGERRGEICGLRWSDIDGDRITVQRRVISQPTVQVLEGTKGGGPRTITLDPMALGALEQLGELQAERANQVGAELAPLEVRYLFSSDGFGYSPRTPDSVGRTIVRYADRLGYTFRLHALRHFMATELLAQGVDVVTVSERLGHKDGGALLLQVYAHVIEGRDRDAAAIIGATLTPKPKPAALPAAGESTDIEDARESA